VGEQVEGLALADDLEDVEVAEGAIVGQRVVAALAELDADHLGADPLDDLDDLGDAALGDVGGADDVERGAAGLEDRDLAGRGSDGGGGLSGHSWVHSTARSAEARCYGRRMSAPEIDERTRTELEAAAFRRLVAHFRERTDVQNLDVMNLAGFCRNCLAKWYRAAAEERGVELSYDDAREIIYGMPYEAWKAQYQK
jgi:hypothetical protein